MDETDHDMLYAILILHVASMIRIKFQWEPTYGLRDVIRKTSRWQSRISEWNNSSPCCLGASHKVLGKLKI